MAGRTFTEEQREAADRAVFMGRSFWYGGSSYLRWGWGDTPGEAGGVR